VASTFFQDYNENNPIVSAWLNDINNGIYSVGKIPKLAAQISSAWVRFNVNAGIVTIQQSSNVASVARTSAGLYVITYAAALTNVANCYSLSSNSTGFANMVSETAAEVTVQFANTSDVATDPGFVSLVVFGAN
jgi:hypothetical protein